MAEEIHYVNIGIQKALHERAVEHSKRLGIESFAGFVRFLIIRELTSEEKGK